MTHTFLIFGYGIPKDILKDQSYHRYLIAAFNHIYSIVESQQLDHPLIITCGGKTDMRKPYTRSEAGEMVRFFRALKSEHTYLKPITKSWKWIAENTSISSVENLLESKKIVEKRGVIDGDVTIFCEITRQKRIHTLAKKVYPSPYRVHIIPIDFDLCENRYLGADYLRKKEKMETQHCLWALKNPDNLKRHHALIKEKLSYLRDRKRTDNGTKEWWDKELQKTSE